MDDAPIQRNRSVAESSLDIPLDDDDPGHRFDYRSPSPSFTPGVPVMARNYEVESESESLSRSSRASYDPDDLRRLIPPEMMKRNHVLPPSCIFHCPVPNCNTALDLKGKLPRWALQVLDKDQIKFLKRGGWTARSGDAQHIFRVMLNAHYVDHFYRLGLAIVGVSRASFTPQDLILVGHTSKDRAKLPSG